jgi:ribosomal protein L13E
MTDLGAELESLRNAANRFADGAQRMNAVASHLSAQTAVLSNRYGAQRQQLESVSRALQRHSVTLRAFSGDLETQRRDQERVSGDSGQGGHVGGIVAGAVGGSAAVGALLRGIPRPVRSAVSGRLLPGRRRPNPLSSISKAVVGDRGRLWTSFVRETHERSGIARGSIEVGQGISRAYRTAPHAPRTLKRFLKLNVRDFPKAFDSRKVGAVTKAKYLKEVRKSSGMLVGSLAALGLQKLGHEKASVGVSNALNAVSGLRDFKTISNLKKLSDLRHPLKLLKPVTKISKPVMRVSRLGGGFAIVSGGLGLVETAQKWKAGDISGGVALRDGGVNSAYMVGGALMLFPGTAPIGAAIVAGASVVQAGVWIYDNRKQIGAVATRAASAVRNVVANPVQAARATGAFASKVSAGAKKTVGKIFKGFKR